MSNFELTATSSLPLATAASSLGRRAANLSSFTEGPLQLDVRDAVAVRRLQRREQTLFYLSLFDDEIDLRLEEFLAFRPQTTWDELTLIAAARKLEPTDAVVITCGQSRIFIVRGGNCNFPLYWTKVAGSIRVSTILPVDRDRRLSWAGLVASVAVVAMTYQNEPNLPLLAPLHGWFRCRRGAISSLSPDSRCVSEYPVDLAAPDDKESGREQLIEAIRSALEKFGRRQRGRAKALVELSGGFDSTLAAIAVRNQRINLVGVSVSFPYYEFRFEEDIQQAAAKSLSISRLRLDGTTLFAYAPTDWWPRLDEPATSIIALKRDLTIARLASSNGINRVFVGQGGDQLFGENMLEPLPAPTPLARGAFTDAAWRAMEAARNLMQSNATFLRRSTLTYLYDARLDVSMKEAFGTITRSPFTDLAMIQCGLSWATFCARQGSHLGKRILKDAFVSELPQAVVGRRGKVCWDGICARAYALHGNSITNELESARDVLEGMGLDMRWLVRRVGQLARWEKTMFGKDDREIFAVYALATWLRSWGIQRMSDCSWSD